MLPGVFFLLRIAMKEILLLSGTNWEYWKYTTCLQRTCKCQNLMLKSSVHLNTHNHQSPCLLLCRSPLLQKSHRRVPVFTQLGDYIPLSRVNKAPRSSPFSHSTVVNDEETRTTLAMITILCS